MLKGKLVVCWPRGHGSFIFSSEINFEKEKENSFDLRLARHPRDLSVTCWLFVCYYSFYRFVKESGQADRQRHMAAIPIFQSILMINRRVPLI